MDDLDSFELLDVLGREDLLLDDCVVLGEVVLVEEEDGVGQGVGEHPLETQLGLYLVGEEVAMEVLAEVLVGGEDVVAVDEEEGVGGAGDQLVDIERWQLAVPVLPAELAVCQRLSRLLVVNVEDSRDGLFQHAVALQHYLDGLQVGHIAHQLLLLGVLNALYHISQRRLSPWEPLHQHLHRLRPLPLAYPSRLEELLQLVTVVLLYLPTKFTHVVSFLVLRIRFRPL